MYYTSQVGQDKFVLDMLDLKRNGTFVEIGAYHSKEISNTYVLEKEFGWKGLGFEIEFERALEYNTNRISQCVCGDARTIDYLKLFQDYEMPKRIDYLQIDIDPADRSLAALKALPLREYRFSVITFEHDLYNDPNNIFVKNEQQEILKSLGYKLMLDNALCQGGPFEDWWVDPRVVFKEEPYTQAYY